MQNLFKNWKTTSAGLVLIVPAVVDLVFGIIHGTSHLTAILAGLGLMFAGDASAAAKEHAALNQKVEQTQAAIVSGDTSIITTPQPPVVPPKP